MRARLYRQQPQSRVRLQAEFPAGGQQAFPKACLHFPGASSRDSPPRLPPSPAVSLGSLPCARSSGSHRHPQTLRLTTGRSSRGSTRSAQCRGDGQHPVKKVIGCSQSTTACAAPAPDPSRRVRKGLRRSDVSTQHQPAIVRCGWQSDLRCLHRHHTSGTANTAGCLPHLEGGPFPGCPPCSCQNLKAERERNVHSRQAMRAGKTSTWCCSEPSLLCT